MNTKTVKHDIDKRYINMCLKADAIQKGKVLDTFNLVYICDKEVIPHLLPNIYTKYDKELLLYMFLGKSGLIEIDSCSPFAYVPTMNDLFGLLTKNYYYERSDHAIKDFSSFAETTWSDHFETSEEPAVILSEIGYSETVTCLWLMFYMRKMCRLIWSPGTQTWVEK